MTAKKTEFIVTDLISKIFQRKTIMDKLPSQRELAVTGDSAPDYFAF